MNDAQLYKIANGVVLDSTYIRLRLPQGIYRLEKGDLVGGRIDRNLIINGNSGLYSISLDFKAGITQDRDTYFKILPGNAFYNENFTADLQNVEGNQRAYLLKSGSKSTLVKETYGLEPIEEGSVAVLTLQIYPNDETAAITMENILSTLQSKNANTQYAPVEGEILDSKSVKLKDLKSPISLSRTTKLSFLLYIVLAIVVVVMIAFFR